MIRAIAVSILAGLAGTALTLTGCGGGGASPTGPPDVGGPCRYQEFAGKATITAVRAPDPGALSCKDPREVLFDFLPDDPAAPATYRFPGTPDTGRRLTVGDGKNPPRPWVEAEGLTPGAIHPARRMEIVQGTCTPVLFTLTDLDLTSWTKDCF